MKLKTAVVNTFAINEELSLLELVKEIQKLKERNNDFSLFDVKSMAFELINAEELMFTKTRKITRGKFFPAEMIKVFLGGTCNGSSWRNKLIPLLKINYFNPVVDDWTPEHQAIEIVERESCSYCLYVITPKMKGVYSIAEAATDSCKRNTVFCVLPEDDGLVWDESQKKSLDATLKLLSSNGAKCFTSLDDVANYLNGKK